jgi:hypothetical protein
MMSVISVEENGYALSESIRNLRETIKTLSG